MKTSALVRIVVLNFIGPKANLKASSCARASRSSQVATITLSVNSEADTQATVAYVRFHNNEA